MFQRSSVATASSAYLFSYFIENGEDGLHLAWSTDGYRWTELNGGSSFLRPLVGESRLMRDPFLYHGPDGLFHLVWTTSWRGRTIGHASSRDLQHWSEQRALPVMAHEPAVMNCWAPEVVFDAAAGHYVIFWSSSIPGRFPETDAFGDDGHNHRIYATATSDWETFAPVRLFFDGGFNVIDATVAQDGERFRLIVKDETKTPVRKHLRCATGLSPRGPFMEVSEPFSRDWVEGPSALHLGDHWLIYFDEYTRGCYGAVRTADFNRFEDVSGQLLFPPGVRHGNALRVPIEVIQNLL